MVILITGTSHTGKTVLAQRMLEKYNYPYLSMSIIVMEKMFEGIPEKDKVTTIQTITKIEKNLRGIVS